jgi:hypothetical protein
MPSRTRHMLTSALLTSALSVAMLTRSTMRAKRIRYVRDTRASIQTRTWTQSTDIEVIA